MDSGLAPSHVVGSLLVAYLLIKVSSQRGTVRQANGARKAINAEYDRLWRDDGGRDGTPDDVRTAPQRLAWIHRLVFGECVIRGLGSGGGVSRRVWCVGACRVGVGGWVGLVALGCVLGVPAPGGWVFR